MTALDVIVFAVLGGGAIFGFMRGFVQEVLALLVWLLILFAIRFFHAPIAEAMTGIVGTQGGAAVAAYLLITAVAFIGGRMTARAVGKQTRSSLLGPVDRILGFGFGVVKGLAIMSLMFLAVILVNDLLYGEESEHPAWLTSSRSYPLLNASGSALSEYISENRAKGLLPNQASFSQ